MCRFILKIQSVRGRLLRTTTSEGRHIAILDVAAQITFPDSQSVLLLQEIAAPSSARQQFQRMRIQFR